MRIWGGRHPAKLGVVLVLWGFGALLAACGTDVSNQAVMGGSTLCRTTFDTCITPIFNLPMRRSDSAPGETVQCASGGCHEVGSLSGGSYKIFPNASTPEQLAGNYFVSLYYASGSVLLLEPFAGPMSHGGGDILPNDSDPCYIAINNWISTLVDDPADPSCRVCGAAPLPAPPSGCGY